MNDDHDFPDGPRPRPLREREPSQLTDEERQMLAEEEAADRVSLGCMIAFLVLVIAYGFAGFLKLMGLGQ